MNFFILILTTTFLLFTSCKEIISYPKASPVSGDATVNTNHEANKISGFSFAAAKTISYPNARQIVPDILLSVQTSEEGKPLGVFLTTPKLLHTFHLKFYSKVLDSARAYFDTLSTITDTMFQYLALPAKKGQVWAVKTNENKFAKIFITDTKFSIDSTDIKNIILYGKATFKWRYQPDGSRTF